MDESEYRKRRTEIVLRDLESMRADPQLERARAAVISASWRAVIEAEHDDESDYSPTENEAERSLTEQFVAWNDVRGASALANATLLQEMGEAEGLIAAAYADDGALVPSTSFRVDADGSSDPVLVVVNDIPRSFNCGACVVVPLAVAAPLHFLVPPIAGIARPSQFDVSKMLVDGTFQARVYLPPMPGKHIIFAVFGDNRLITSLLTMHSERDLGVAAIEHVLASIAKDNRSQEPVVAWSTSHVFEVENDE